jgi:hypothetical protein
MWVLLLISEMIKENLVRNFETIGLLQMCNGLNEHEKIYIAIWETLLV